MRRTLILLSLSLLMLLSLPPALSAMGEEDPPTLIISIGGIGSYKPGASGGQIFDQVQDMFGTKVKGYSSPPTVYLADRTRRGGIPLDAGKLRSEAERVAKIATQSSHTVLRFQTEIPGIDDLMKANLKDFMPSMPLDNYSSLARSITDTLIRGRETPDNDYPPFRTRWEQETRRGAMSVEAAARAFKDKYGKEARVILVSHSAGTDLVNMIRTIDKTKKKRLIDWRIMSSPRAHTLRYPPDPEHTIFITHKSDFPASPFGKLDDPRARGDLEKQGLVLEMSGIPFWRPMKAHSKTFEYNDSVEMKITTPHGKGVSTRTEAANVIRTLINLSQKDVGGGIRVFDRLIRKLEVEKPKESRVGGISLTKLADVPINAADILELQFNYPYTVVGAGLNHNSLRFLMKSGETIYLPQLDVLTAAAAFNCVFNDRLPEINIMPVLGANGTWWRGVDYKKCQDCLPFTQLGDALLEADRLVGDLALGNYDTYNEPITIENYHPYVELAWDNHLFDDHMNGKPKRGIRAWIVPSVISTELFANQLQYEKIRMAFRFEAFSLAHADEYWAGKGKGYFDPAGEFLAAQLTSNFDELIGFSEITLLKKTAGLVGILIWARHHNVYAGKSSRDEALRVLRQNPVTYRGKRLLQIREVKVRNTLGQEVLQKVYVHRDPAGKERKLKFDDIKRPSPIFNEFSLSRLLWTDGNESKIVYDEKGRIVSLIARQGDKTDILYDRKNNRPLAIVDSKGNGVAVIWTDEMPILCRQVTVDANYRKVVFHRRSRFEVADDVGAVFTDLLASWLKKQTLNESTDEWLAGESHWYDFSAMKIFYVLVGVILTTLLIRRFTLTGSIKMTWALHKLEHGRGYEIPRRATETLAKSGDPRVASALVNKINKQSHNLYTVDALRVIHNTFNALRMIGAPAVNPLISLLKDNEANVRQSAAETLGEIRDPHAVEPLGAFIDEDEDIDGWIAGVKALGKIGDDRCVAILIQILLHELRNPGVQQLWRDRRIAVIDALCDTRNRAALEPLSKALCHVQRAVRSNTVHALGQMGDARIVPLLVSCALTDEDVELRKEAVEAFRKLGWRPESTQMKVDLAIAIRDWTELENLGSAAVLRLIEELQEEECSFRVEVVKILGKIGDVRAVGPLVAALGNDLINETVLGALESIGPSVAAPLTDTFKHQKPHVRARIAKTLGKLGKASIPGLRMALEDPDFEVRLAAIEALGHNEALQSVILIEDIFRRGSDVRLLQTAVQALGRKTYNTEVVAFLTEAFHNASDPGLRFDAIAALGDIRIINAIGPLVEALGDKDDKIQEKAKKALDSWAFERFMPEQDRCKPANEEERNLLTLAGLTVDLLNFLNAPPVPFSWSDEIMASQKEARLQNLVSVIRQLGIIGDSRAVGPLTLALRHESVTVRQAATDVLDEIKGIRGEQGATADARKPRH